MSKFLTLKCSQRNNKHHITKIYLYKNNHPLGIGILQLENILHMNDIGYIDSTN